MPSLYELIAPWYDEIFPLDASAADFVASSFDLPGNPFLPHTILEAGCGTGTLAIELTRRGYRVDAIDLEPNLIDRALRNAAAVEDQRKRPSFAVMDMRFAGDAYAPESYGVVACLGNTLPHLKGPEEMLSCVKGFRRLLPRGGFLVIQIVDFERFMRQGDPSLPTIESPNLRFRREYHGIAPHTPFEFRAELRILGTGQEAKASTTLWPLLRSEIRSILREAGFSPPEFHGGFSGQPEGSGLPLVVRAQAEEASA